MTQEPRPAAAQSPGTVDARTLQGWLQDGRAVLVDIREADEHAREHIPGALHVPLSGFDPAGFDPAGFDPGGFDPGGFEGLHDRIGVFHCASGNRTASAAGQLGQAAFREVFLLQGGLQAWRSAGLPVAVNRRAPLPLMRQVMNAAGSLVATGVLLGILVSPWFLALSGFVGAGLAFAGITGFCGMSRILAVMPWNRTGPAAPAGLPASAGTGGAP